MAALVVSKDAITYKKRINLIGTLANTLINDFVHLFDIVHSAFVDLIVNDDEIDQMITNAKMKQKLIYSDKKAR